MIEQAEVPPGWQSDGPSHTTTDTIEAWGIFYEPVVPDSFGTQSTITQDITVFKREDMAIKVFEEYYQDQLSRADEVIKAHGTPRKNFEPPQKYRYKSLVADEFKVIYFPLKSPFGPVVGFRYDVYARYGNVISAFYTVVEDEEQTGIKAGEANVLPWTEVERLLKLIDEKFQKEGF